MLKLGPQPGHALRPDRLIFVAFDAAAIGLMHALQGLGQRDALAHHRAGRVRGLGELAGRDFLAFWNMQSPVQRTGMLDGTFDPVPGLTTGSFAAYPR